MTEKGDLISREALKKAIEQGEGFSWDSYGKDDLCVRKKYIDNAPTVDKIDEYVEAFKKGMAEIDDARPQGEWIIIKSPLSNETIVKCNKCGEEFIGNDVEDYNYCPMCSADMKGDKE